MYDSCLTQFDHLCLSSGRWNCSHLNFFGLILIIYFAFGYLTFVFLHLLLLLVSSNFLHSIFSTLCFEVIYFISTNSAFFLISPILFNLPLLLLVLSYIVYFFYLTWLLPYNSRPLFNFNHCRPNFTTL